MELIFRTKPSQILPAKTGRDLIPPTALPDVIEKHKRAVTSRKVRMYDGAMTDNTNSDFPISITSANAEILTSIIGVRGRARRLERDESYATGIITAFQNNVVGDDPFPLEVNVGTTNADGTFTKDVKVSQDIKDFWKWCGLKENFLVSRNYSRNECYWQAISAVVRDGGIIYRKWPGFPNNDIRYAIEAVEIDRLDHFFNRPGSIAGGKNEIQFSIELDKWMGPVAYWLLTRHPGDTYAWSNQTAYRERVAAEEIIPLFNIRSRAGQLVGMSKLATVINPLHRLRQYDKAEMTAAIVTACKMGFFTKTDTTDEYSGDNQNDDGGKSMNATPGSFEELPEGYNVTPWDPKHPVEAYPAFVNQHLRAVGQGSGLSHSTVSGDYTNMSFSSGRLEKTPEKQEFKKYQSHVIADFVFPDYAARLKYGILSGKLAYPIERLEEFLNASTFLGVRWEYINPLQDAQADILRIEGGLTSRSRVIAESEYPGSFEDVCREQQTDNDTAERHKLDFSASDPTTPTVPKGAPGQEAPEPGNVQPPPRTGSKQTIKKSFGRILRIMERFARMNDNQ